MTKANIPSAPSPDAPSDVPTVLAARDKRRLEVASALATRSAAASTTAEALDGFVAALEEASDDVPFALVYRLCDGSTDAQLVAAVGIEAIHPAAVASVNLAAPSAPWPLREAQGGPFELSLPTGLWPQGADAAVVIPLRRSMLEGCFGFVVCGALRSMPVDDGRRSFLQLLCAQLTTALAVIELQKKLVVAAETADAAAGVKDEFLAMLGHELRNPLSPILTALQLTRMRGTESRELVIIERQVGHLVRLVDDLLDISRITGGKIALRKKRFELSAIVARGLEMVGPLFDQKKQRLDLHVLFEGLVVDADPDRLAQVVVNLLTNAAKYSDAGTTIRVTADRVGNQARLSVRDEGLGIPANMLQAIFDRFVQQRQALDRSKGGLGLGLTIVRSLVQLHGGTVAAFSEGTGRGSEFVVQIPLAEPEHASDGDGPGVWSALHRFRNVGNRNRVLVVDDNRDGADSVADVLTSLGYQVAVAYDGPSAVTVAETFKPHTCVLDIGLPVMDGYEVARRLRQSTDLPEGLCLIAVTGYGLPSDRQRAKEAGFDAHLVKPVQLDELAKIVAN